MRRPNGIWPFADCVYQADRSVAAGAGCTMARSRRDVPAARLQALNAGAAETANLVEALAMDLAHLVQVVAPLLGGAATSALAAARSDLGYAKRLAAIGQAIGGAGVSTATLEALTIHPSDTVRGWAAYARVAVWGTGARQAVAAVEPLAADSHFGVREWAWMAARPVLARDVAAGIAAVVPMTAHADANRRRFASEVLRPVGVWCPAIPSLRKDPQPGLAILDPLAADPSRYVQDSVANWLNDAARTQAPWVRAVCRTWRKRHDGAATARIVERALRRCGD
jgi:3-methyladenine DNA glycosylase AlkC